MKTNAQWLCVLRACHVMKKYFKIIFGAICFVMSCYVRIVTLVLKLFCYSIFSFQQNKRYPNTSLK